LQQVSALPAGSVSSPFLLALRCHNAGQAFAAVSSAQPLPPSHRRSTARRCPRFSSPPPQHYNTDSDAPSPVMRDACLASHWSLQPHRFGAPPPEVNPPWQLATPPLRCSTARGQPPLAVGWPCWLALAPAACRRPPAPWRKDVLDEDLAKGFWQKGLRDGLANCCLSWFRCLALAKVAGWRMVGN
jgi:hypothetical protein